ncbi:MAG: nitroreductase family protein [Pseudomonadota bacterium]|nr:nitroreductase family protein [Pseudomonadota bacterium]
MSTLDRDVFETRSPEAEADDGFVRRWSPRAFSGAPLSLDQVHVLVEAARWAPSCFNSQPWRFIYALNGDDRWADMLAILMDMNQVWAQRAGVLIAVVAKTTFDDGQSAPTASFDTGSAWMSMALQAQSMGLASHAMWGFHHDQAPAALELPPDHDVQAMVAVGYPGEVSVLPEKYQEREIPSPRRHIDELLFHGKFG